MAGGISRLPLLRSGRYGNTISAPSDPDRGFAGGFASKSDSITLTDRVRLKLFLKVSADCVIVCKQRRTRKERVGEMREEGGGGGKNREREREQSAHVITRSKAALSG